MLGLTSRLRNKVTLYAKQPTINELGEDTFDYAPVKSMYAEIVPINGSRKTLSGNVTQITTTHKIIIRSSSVKELTNDMYFVYKNQRYDIDYFNPNYKYNDSIEILVKLVDGVYKNE